ncbi:MULTISPECIES: DUF4138 domain-containing protein [unclassified Spirosoma]|uniref:DUF4138 domain-containing protein n=1 Tax=unclassified Spirosoma TaxID=2621999 RepID=UPI00096802EF|nr:MULTISPECIES: DUF4138 domain-containing protein [unclassified Spirosoma]MBN8826771.1 DUF4138 domain-containing protein [Spirosoma sp.]OJW71167.1 MAG: hypothetical protein BGO59_27920 [Spirosoma sp. 48-14]
MNILWTLAFWSILLPATAQHLDTITVSVEGTSYVIFDEPISLVNLGTKAYVGKVENERMLFLKALAPNATPTTLLIQAGSKLFTGYIRYERNPSKSFYDYRVLDEGNTRSNQLSSTVAPASSKLTRMKVIKPNTHIREEKDGIDLECVQLFNDAERTYLKIAFHNTTTVAYVLDIVSFTYKEKLPRRLRNKVAPQFEEMKPDDRLEPARIEAGRTEAFYYSLPLYSTTEDGYLEIIFREKVGARVVTLEVPAQKIMKAPLL